MKNLLTPHPSTALEYWFFKVNAGSTALLVDWIARRGQNENVLRVSIHSTHQRVVLFDKLPSPMIDEQNFITTQRTVGQLGDISWALDIECDNERVDPNFLPDKLLRITDLALISAPLAKFTGWIQHGPLRVELQHARGMMAHYWGRQLPHEWWWVSANQFDQKEIAVDCGVIRTSVWGIPARLPLAYLSLSHANVRKFIVAPPAITKVTGTPEQFEIQFRPFAAKTITLRAKGRDYGDLGDGIFNTLVGDLEVWEGDKRIARAEGTAALERRAPQSTTAHTAKVA